MNLDVQQVGGEVMVVSQFTLHASTKKGNRPSYFRAAGEAISRPMYEEFVREVEQQLGQKVATGEFGADMKVALVNDGPVTIWIDSRNREENEKKNKAAGRSSPTIIRCRYRVAPCGQLSLR